MNMRTSPAGRASIMQREGVRLKAYRDSVNVLTIGVGHTGRASPPSVTAGMSITALQADQFLASDLAPMENAVNGAVRAPLTQSQFDACVSLAFNIGAGGFASSTVVRKLNKGDYAGAADAFLLWEKPAVLKSRREAERRQFLSGVSAPIPPAVALPPAAPGAPPAAAGSPFAAFFRWLAGLFAKRPAPAVKPTNPVHEMLR